MDSNRPMILPTPRDRLLKACPDLFNLPISLRPATSFLKKLSSSLRSAGTPDLAMAPIYNKMANELGYPHSCGPLLGLPATSQRLWVQSIVQSDLPRPSPFKEEPNTFLVDMMAVKLENSSHTGDMSHLRPPVKLTASNGQTFVLQSGPLQPNILVLTAEEVCSLANGYGMFEAFFNDRIKVAEDIPGLAARRQEHPISASATFRIVTPPSAPKDYNKLLELALGEMREVNVYGYAKSLDIDFKQDLVACGAPAVAVTNLEAVTGKPPAGKYIRIAVDKPENVQAVLEAAIAVVGPMGGSACLKQFHGDAWPLSRSFLVPQALVNDLPGGRSLLTSLCTKAVAQHFPEAQVQVSTRQGPGATTVAFLIMKSAEDFEAFYELFPEGLSLDIPLGNTSTTIGILPKGCPVVARYPGELIFTTADSIKFSEDAVDEDLIHSLSSFSRSLQLLDPTYLKAPVISEFGSRDKGNYRLSFAVDQTRALLIALGVAPLKLPDALETVVRPSLIFDLNSMAKRPGNNNETSILPELLQGVYEKLLTKAPPPAIVDYELAQAPLLSLECAPVIVEESHPEEQQPKRVRQDDREGLQQEGASSMELDQK